MKPAKRLLAALLVLAFAGCSQPSSVPPPSSTTSAEQATSTPAPTRSPVFWQEWTDPFSPEAARELENRAGSWWEEQLDRPSRYAWVMDIQSRYLPPEQWSEEPNLADILTFSQELDSSALEQGTAGICRVDFTFWYQPETYYMGPQYGDGACYVYLLVYQDRTREAQSISGWYSPETTAQRPENPDASSLGLNDYQYTMLTHQCRALAAAGITTLPEDWTAQELARYLVARGQDFGRKPEEWAANTAYDFLPGMILSIDFTGEDDAWANAPSPDLLKAITPEDWETALAALDTPAGNWTYQKEEGQVTAVLEGDVAYTFSLCLGFAEWNSRTFCTGIREL